MLPHERGECYVSPHTSYGSPNMSFDTSVQSADGHNRSKSSTGTGMLPHERGESYIYEDEAGSTTTIVQPRTRQKIFVVILCLLHVGLGVGCMALQISSMMWKSRAANVSSGVWCGVMFIATGISGVIALVPFSLKVVRIFMILNIVCLVLVPVMWGCVIASMVLDHIHQRYHPDMLPHERGEIYVTPDTTKSQLSDEDEEHNDAETVQQPRGWTACTVILCLFHVALGIGCIALQICSMVTKSRAANVSSGVWCGVMYIATGIAGIIALIPFSMKVLRIFKIMNIVNLVLVPLMWGCVIASMVLDHIHQRYHPDRWKWNLFNGLLLGAGAMELLMAALSLVMCCRAGLLCLGQQCCIDEDDDEEDENQQY